MNYKKPHQYNSGTFSSLIDQNLNVFAFAFDKSQITFTTNIRLELISLSCEFFHSFIATLPYQHKNINLYI